MARVFRFISQDYDILDLLDGGVTNIYTVEKFHFQMLYPDGNISYRELDYKTTYKNRQSIRLALTLLVVKHSPKWYYVQYVDIFPIKVTALEIKFYGKKS